MSESKKAFDKYFKGLEGVCEIRKCTWQACWDNHVEPLRASKSFLSEAFDLEQALKIKALEEQLTEAEKVIGYYEFRCDPVKCEKPYAYKARKYLEKYPNKTEAFKDE